jgi:hypothetical protein
MQIGNGTIFACVHCHKIRWIPEGKLLSNLIFPYGKEVDIDILNHAVLSNELLHKYALEVSNAISKLNGSSTSDRVRSTMARIAPVSKDTDTLEKGIKPRQPIGETGIVYNRITSLP